MADSFRHPRFEESLSVVPAIAVVETDNVGKRKTMKRRRLQAERENADAG